ncbi:hypothetical protein QWZ06_11210 [Chryseobacterium tructae]|uniref:WYL domain-containing protein n=1 Tax=Chryseobacterium tructae TaxID=1037380 RepID=A0ABV7XVQ9_9FLAO|nr:hypothetical protein [Chryseobacterium tructae]MDN3692804.1 hypothetical protein [Chryseobacterium tructae]
MKQKDVPILQYPWSYEIGPFSQSFYEEETSWIDTDYQFMSESTRKKYKKHGLAEATSYMFPAASTIEQIRPIARFMVWLTLYDDYYEVCPVNKLIDIRNHIMDIMMGEKPKSD